MYRFFLIVSVLCVTLPILADDPPIGTSTSDLPVHKTPKLSGNQVCVWYEEGNLYFEANTIANYTIVVYDEVSGEEQSFTVYYNGDDISIPANLNVGMYGIVVYMDDVCIFETEIEV